MGFDRERKCYLRLKPELLRQHKGQFAAIYDGRLIGVNSNKAKLIESVRLEYGSVRAYIAKVQDVEPQVRLPTSRRLISEGKD